MEDFRFSKTTRSRAQVSSQAPKYTPNDADARGSRRSTIIIVSVLLSETFDLSDRTDLGYSVRVQLCARARILLWVPIRSDAPVDDHIRDVDIFLSKLFGQTLRERAKGEFTGRESRSCLVPSGASSRVCKDERSAGSAFVNSGFWIYAF